MKLSKTRIIARTLGAAAFVCCVSLPSLSAAESAGEEQVAEQCTFQDSSGVFRSVSGLEKVPAELRTKAACRKLSTRTTAPARPSTGQARTTKDAETIVTSDGFTVNEFADAMKQSGVDQVHPGEVKIQGNARTTEVLSNLGPVMLRWPRSVEGWFGKTPEQAVKDAWLGASRALAQNSFPTALRSAKYNWSLVFMDLVPGDVDVGGSKNVCHPAWMKPPADIYVAAERVLTLCGSQRFSEAEATATLTRSLVHELGHAVEFQFLGKAFGQFERWRSEGFATWFETLGNQFVTGPGRGASRADMRAQAKVFWTPGWTPDQFQGSAEDYARSYALIAVIAETKSVSTLASIYRRMEEKNIPIAPAVQEVLQWDQAKWLREAGKFIGAPGSK